MAHDSVDATRGFPQYAGTGAPADAADLSEIATWAGTNIDRIVATQAALGTVYTPVYTGMLVSVTAIQPAVFRYNAGTWQMIGIPVFNGAAARDAAITSPQMGMMCFRSDVANAPQTYNGNAWRYMGLVPIPPTSVSGTGVALGTGGQVNLTTVTAAQINGIFTAEFDNYRVDLDLPDSTAGITATMQLSVGGTPDATVSNYDTLALQGVGAAASSGQVIGTVGSWGVIAGSAGNNRIMDTSMEFKRPFLTKPTEILATGHANSTTMTANSAVGTKLLAHRAATSYDGITFAFATGTPSGVLHIYGWNN